MWEGGGGRTSVQYADLGAGGGGSSPRVEWRALSHLGRGPE